MINLWNKLDVRIKMLIPMLLTITAMFVIGMMALLKGEQTRIGGPIDDDIQNGKDLVADILPPPMYVVELHLAGSQAACSTDAKRQEKFRGQFTQFMQQYYERQQHWTKTLPDGKIKEIVVGSLNQSVKAYFSACEQQFIPSLASKDTVTSLKMYNTVMVERYNAQRESVDQVVALVTSANDSRYTEAKEIGKSNFRFNLVGSILAAVVGVAFTSFVMVSVVKQIKFLIAIGRDYEMQINAISKEQLLIEFDLNGKVLKANDNFLRSMSYSAHEILGQHHSIFALPSYSSSPEYAEFWSRLRRGEFVSGEVQRQDKHGRYVWLLASYNPILNDQGVPFKILKTATVITQAKELQQKVAEQTVQQHKDSELLQSKVTVILKTVDQIAQGDFTTTVPDLGDDAIGKVGQALNKAVSSVRSTLEGVAEVSDHLADASTQLAAACEEISSGAQEQASSLEETASTLEEITATVKQNSDSSQQARQLASNSRDVAEKGGQVVGHAVDAMDAINQSSKKIAEIITAIDEIAFQTNLLALNAAVEAARAGEQGRGFAVVASEVRNLAQRSASAAKEIKTLIQDSVKKVDAGTELVNRSGHTLHEIVTSVKRVTDIVSEIAAASREQSAGIDQVNKAVTQMDSVTQQNASQTEEMSATAQNLSDQAKQLRDLLSRFRLQESDIRTATKPSAKPVVKDRARTNGTKLSTKPRPAVVKAIKNSQSRSNMHELDMLGESDSEIDGYTEF